MCPLITDEPTIALAKGHLVSQSDPQGSKMNLSLHSFYCISVMRREVYGGLLQRAGLILLPNVAMSITLESTDLRAGALAHLLSQEY